MGKEIVVPDPAGHSEVETSNESAASLVRRAIDKGVDVAVLERLVALQERVTERNARAAFFAAVSAFQDECPQIHKSKTAKIATSSGGAYEYTFAPLEEITRVIRPILQKHGLAYSWDTEQGAGGILNVICIVRHVDGHEERTTFPVPTASPAKMSEAQKIGAALTYGRRQSLVSALGIIASDDVDGGDPVAGEPVSEFQARELEEKIKQTGADRARFLAFMGAAEIKQIPAAYFDKAMKTLDRKAKASA